MVNQDILQKVIAVVKEVAVFQLSHFRAVPESAVDVKALRETVSFVDVESEKILHDGLMPLIEGAGFYGEESGKSGSQELMWVVDPLDGTTNFLSGIDQFSVSVALVEHGQPILGVICKPFSNEIYSAIKGNGAFYNGILTKPVNASPATQDALFITGFPYRSPELAEGFFRTAAKVLTLGRGIRRTGSAALDVANLSMGWAQGFWETHLQPYDVAAGIIMMQENGVTITNEQGEPFNMFDDLYMVAGFPAVHADLLEAVREGYSVSYK